MVNKAREGTCSSDPTCSCCDSPIELSYFDSRLPLPAKMKEEGICFSCAFWKDKIDNPLPNREIINGVHYVFHDWQEQRTYFQGHGGRKMYIITNDRVPKRSNNVWCQGDIPACFQDSLPDTAVFVSQKIYNKICENPNFKCQAKGCWDRHHCYWFDESLNQNGEWNIVPDGHKTGEENCTSFINKTEIYG